AGSGKATYFLSDRHGLSYDVVKDWCEKEGCTTLVLLDQHNDVSADSATIHSYDWAGQLVDRGIVSEVYWVCQSEASSLELAAKRRWLEQNTRNKSEENARRILEAFHIVDFASFRSMKPQPPQKPYAVSVDLDLYDGEAETEPVRFIRESCEFLKSERCPLVTVCLSAAYQKRPEAAWNYLETFMQEAPGTARWLFASGDFGEKEESREEQEAFARWKNDIAAFQGYQCGFYRGAYLWLNDPPAIQELFARKQVTAYNPEDKMSATVLMAMQDKRAMEGLLAPYSSKDGLEQLHRAAIAALEKYFSGAPLPPPPETHCAFDDIHSRGIAVRYRTAREDRGCLALYSGLDFTAGDALAAAGNAQLAAGYASWEAARDPRYRYIEADELDGLFINISLFSYWEPMADSDNFIPGLDSLLLVNPEAESPGQRETLLQASLASERGYSKEDFLRRLSRKAGLDADGYKEPALRFYKAKTVSYTAQAARSIP
ncbi:MAG: AMMECR1 domain-containing protein, partial [Treponema sp.]|nr:AMMECR1 domain-containing protein [Treponema sp.]